jgi:DoxX-like family
VRRIISGEIMGKKMLWGLQIVLALAFAGSGSLKLITAKDTLEQQPNMGWAAEFSQWQIRAIGGAEVAGAVGLIAPAATGIAPILSPIASAGLAAIMGGAAKTHIDRGEPPYAPLVLGVLSIVVAVGRLRARP